MLDQKPQKIHFSGSVQLFSPNIQEKETFAIADTMEMDLNTEKLILKSKAPSRTLVWQEGLHLSAPEIHITQNELQGKGDLRFTFNTNEQNMIEQFLSQYL